jgi:dihydroxyacid dehydratase/phosphogluconate dehydratase
VRDGDRVVIDADVRSIDVPDVSAAEFAQRRLVHTHPFTHAPIATSRQALFP